MQFFCSKESQTNASEEKVDIMQLFAKAQERFDNQVHVQLCDKCTVV